MQKTAPGRVLIVPDKFKGTITARDVAKVISEAVMEFYPELELEAIPLADGGDGSLEIMLNNGYEAIHLECDDALGRRHMSKYAYRNGHAFIELAQICGIANLGIDELDPWNSNSYGVGEVMNHALAKGAKKLTIALGGSASVDGGFGLLGALGAVGFDQADMPVPYSLLGLTRLTKLKLPDDEKWSKSEVEVLADVRNPLLGSSGAVETFGRQKGLRDEELPTAENALKNWASLVMISREGEVDKIAGAGAAGGVGFALSAFFGVTPISGAKWFIERLHIVEEIRKSTYVITAEGRFDEQSMMGKITGEIVKHCHELGIKCAVIAGDFEDFPTGPRELEVLSTTALSGSIHASRSNPVHWIRAAVRDMLIV